MDIAPQDLGPDYGAQIVRWRVPVKAGRLSVLGVRLGAVGLILGGPAGSLLSVPAAMFLNLFHVHFENDPYFLSTYLLGIIGGAGLSYQCGSLVDRQNAGRARARAVTAPEVAHLSTREKDPLKGDYLSVVSAVVALPAPREESARHNIRGAVRSLGQAVAQLPPPRAAADVGALRAEAGRLAAQAQGEHDSVIAASLTRQAEAFGRRADTAARVAVLVRRGQTLRDEVAAQVQAFRASLAAAQISGGHGGGDFAALAESVAQVMQEADALADARAELEASLAPTAPAPEQSAAATQGVRLKTG